MQRLYISPSRVTATCLLTISLTSTTLATPIEIVTPKDPQPLMRFAASELQRDLARLFTASPTVVTSPTQAAEALFLLGTTTHHPPTAAVPPDLPQLSDQGFLLRNTRCANKPAILIIGGSPTATLWGVYELLERYGVRYLLSGDVYPPGKRDVHLPEIDRVFEPLFRARWFKAMGDFAMGMEGWGIADYRPFIDQLAKLKFNRIRIGSGPSQPFLDLQIKGIKRTSAVLWYGARFPITPDMPGRKLFGDEKEFWNPDLPPPGAPYDQLVAAGQRHCHELIAYARSRGIESSYVGSSVTDFPKDFRSIVPDAQTVHQLGELTVAPGPKAKPDDPALNEIAAEIIKAVINEYPEIASYGFPVGTEWPSWIELYEWAWKELDKRYGIQAVMPLEEVLRRANARADYPGGAARAVMEVKGHITGLYFLTRLWTSPDVLPKTKRPDAKLVVYEVAEELYPVLSRILPKNAELVIVVDYNPTRVLRRRHVLSTVPTKDVFTNLVLTLQDDSVGVLPLLTTHALHQLVGDMRKAGIGGFCTRQWMISDHDACMAYLSKASWDPGTTPKAIYVDQISAVCGQPAVEPMLEAFRELEAVTTALEDHGMGLCFPVPNMMTRQWSPGPLPKELSEDRAGYKRARAAVGKVPEPATPEGKAYVRYWLRRLEFAVGYFNAIETVKKAATSEQAAKDAKAKGDSQACRVHLTEAAKQASLAQTTVSQAIEAFAAVAKNRADLGAIATMAEYVYRPLKQKADELRAECAK
ncbi:MAG: hypothetical protein JXQ73_01580 [Phycisphaerae bacterium]|nr:hypothetical protein [Phycisphaerae bacterium]